MSYVEFPKEWADRIREARLSRHRSVAALVKDLKVSRKTYEKIENYATGRCRDATWRDVCVGLGLWEQWKRREREATDRSGATTMELKIDAQKLAGDLDADVFLASAMDSATPADRSVATTEARSLAVAIREIGQTVFFAAEERPGPDRYEDPGWALALNDSLIRRSQRLVLIYPSPPEGERKPPASSALIELGMAIALRVPTLIFHKGLLESLPFMVHKAESAFSNFRLLRYRDRSDLREAVHNVHREFFQVRAPAAG